jgi:protein-S-isoprenylcysteine O-methyltransferase Ste14
LPVPRLSQPAAARPPSLLRCEPPQALLVALVAMAVLHLLAPIERVVPRDAFWAGAALAVLGVALSQSAMRAMLRAGTCTEFAGRPSVLVTGGCFRLSRNPMYLGMLLLLAGEATMLGSLGALLPLAAFLLAMQVWYVPSEERRLRAQFGADWDAYRRRVRRWA